MATVPQNVENHASKLPAPFWWISITEAADNGTPNASKSIQNGVESWVWFDSAAIDPTAGFLTLAYAFRLHLNYVLLMFKGSSQKLRPPPPAL